MAVIWHLIWHLYGSFFAVIGLLGYWVIGLLALDLSLIWQFLAVFFAVIWQF